MLIWAFILGIASLDATPSFAVPMTNDPRGFRELTWGISLADHAELTVARADDRIIDYRLKESPPRFAEIEVESIVFSTIYNEFARVTIRYRGEETHKKLLTYLQQTYGPIERLPGQMTRGLNQQYNWRGPETEINLTYESNRDRGYLFIESRTLSPRFNDQITDTGE
ncbi:MAG: hypothetical protein ABW047_02120 [Nitrospiraceae bacterium]